MHSVIQQHHLENVVCALFPEANVRNPVSGKLLEFDCWIQNINLAFEFQDPYHYITSRLSHLELSAIVQKDCLKREKAHSQQESLLLIPCWWNGEPESLVSTIKFERPDLLTHHVDDNSFPIPLNPPIDFFEQHAVGEVPGVGTLMMASVPDSSQFSLSISSKNPWWVGEKYDGVRACWNPKLQKMFTRSGFEIMVPQPFINNSLSSIGEFMDAELWFGRGGYVEAQRVVSLSSVDWCFLRLIAFDIPTLSPSTPSSVLPSISSISSPIPIPSAPFEKRYETLYEMIDAHDAWTQCAMRKRCDSRRALAHCVRSILSCAGEGLVLRRPASPYVHGRSSLLVKLKATRDDREAIVLDVKADGTLILKTTDGVEFQVPPHDVHLPEAVRAGDVVSFSSESHTRHAMPVRPCVIRVRVDRAWADLVREAKVDSETSDIKTKSESELTPEESGQKLNNVSDKVLGYQVKAKGHWRTASHSNVRLFLISLARSLSLDPLLPSTWYSLSRKDVESVAGGKAALGSMRGGFVKTIMNLFPNIGLDEREFDKRGEYWKNVHNQRKLFVDFANKSGLDALNPASWYPIHNYKRLLLQEQGAKVVLAHFNDRVKDALVHLFPEIHFNRKKFVSSQDKYYEDPNNRRNFFLDFAKSKSFDAFESKNWYTISSQDVETSKGYRAVLSHYRSFPNALLRIFPDIGLDASKFSAHARYFWKGNSNRKRFFEKIAQERGFDPLKADNWHSIAPDLARYKGVKQMVENSGQNSVFDILQEVFPNIGLDEIKLCAPSRKKLEAIQTRRDFFNKFAESHNFDPLVADNWYTVVPSELLNAQGAKIVLKKYNGSWRKALIDLYPEIDFHLDQFTQFPANYWVDFNNRRKFLEQFAEERGLNPLKASTWDSITWKDVYTRKGGSSLLHYYNGNFTKAISHIFPDLT